jgi:hypothetical protein
MKLVKIAGNDRLPNGLNPIIIFAAAQHARSTEALGLSAVLDIQRHCLPDGFLFSTRIDTLYL